MDTERIDKMLTIVLIVMGVPAVVIEVVYKLPLFPIIPFLLH